MNLYKLLRGSFVLYKSLRYRLYGITTIMLTVNIVHYDDHVHMSLVIRRYLV